METELHCIPRRLRFLQTHEVPVFSRSQPWRCPRFYLGTHSTCLLFSGTRYLLQICGSRQWLHGLPASPPSPQMLTPRPPLGETHRTSDAPHVSSAEADLMDGAKSVIHAGRLTSPLSFAKQASTAMNFDLLGNFCRPLFNAVLRQQSCLEDDST